MILNFRSHMFFFFQYLICRRCPTETRLLNAVQQPLLLSGQRSQWVRHVTVRGRRARLCLSGKRQSRVTTGATTSKL